MHIDIHIEIHDRHTDELLADFFVAAVPRTGDAVQIGRREYIVSRVVWFPTNLEHGMQDVVLEVAKKR